MTQYNRVQNHPRHLVVIDSQQHFVLPYSI
jgi:hypothetical protein